MNLQTTMDSNALGNIELQHKSQFWKFVIPILTVIWLGVIVAGLLTIWKYETTPGEITRPPTQWPANSRITLSVDRPTLIVFAHPRCPCTRATIGELAVLVAHCPESANYHVLFVKPSGLSAGWEKSDLWSSAEAIPNVTVLCDEEGFEARRFHAGTSGYSLLYNSNGHLLFRGGITSSRGHAGDNAGRSAIESILLNNATDQKQQTFVFGCPLLNRDKSCDTADQK